MTLTLNLWAALVVIAALVSVVEITSILVDRPGGRRARPSGKSPHTVPGVPPPIPAPSWRPGDPPPDAEA